MNRIACLVALAAASIAAAASPAFAQAAQEGKNPSALAKQNLAKHRPKAPFDLTGTWSWTGPAKGSGPGEWGPSPKLTPSAQAAFDKRQDYRKRGLEYRDNSGACWPLGLPRMMARFWPTEIIQLPTMIQLTAMFNNSIRWIYMDGRPHPNDDDLVYTFNGHSIGRWEGDTLVIDTVGMTDDHHWMDPGIPASTKLHVVERIRMVDGGKAFEDQFTMTDPDNWEGEWMNTKKYTRQDRTDIEEHICIYEQMRQLPSFRSNIRE